MTRKLVIAVLALAPAVALAQLKALDRARDAQRVSDEGNARVQKAADEALAPDQPAPGDGKATPGDDTAAPAPLEGGAASADAGRGGAPAPDTYTVRPGDTLWDLSGRFLNNPWYWPKVWSYNPEIANPHWISPGSVLRFFPSGDEGPAQVEAVEPGEPMVAEEGDQGAPVRELEDLSRADMKAAPTAEEQDSVAVAGPYKIGFVRPRTPYARRDSFVTPHELEESGAIQAAFEEKIMLTERDRAYAQFKHGPPVKVGETYAIFRTERPVMHPVTGELIGYQTTILGAAKVVAMDDKAATLIVTSSSDVIERGAMLGPWTAKPYRPVPAKPNGRDLDGVIVSSPVEALDYFAESQVVFIDRGRAEGVEEGNHFTVVRAGDPYGAPVGQPQWDSKLPKEDVGSLLVVDVREHASAALVTRSLTDLIKGDRVEMRTAAR